MTITQTLSYIIANNGIENYVLFIVTIILSIIFGKYANALIEKIADRLHEKSGIELDELLVRALSLPIAIAITLSGFYFGVNFLVLPTSLQTFINEGIMTAFILCVIVFLDRFFTELVDRYMAQTIAKKTKKDVDDQIIILTKKLVRIVVWTIGLLLILSNLGYDIKTLLAGLGIGGLAIALASQNFVSNLIAGLIIITDKPFKIGNWVTFSGGSGIVEDIGIRSTKIRSLDNSIIVVPNSKLIDDIIQNIPSKNRWKVATTIGITYNTPVEKIKKAEDIIRNILDNHPNVEKDPVTVYFKEFGDWSLNIQVVYYVKNSKYNGYRRYISTINDINLKIKEEFDKEGIDFAFPTYTLHIKKDDDQN